MLSLLSLLFSLRFITCSSTSSNQIWNINAKILVLSANQFFSNYVARSFSKNLQCYCSSFNLIYDDKKTTNTKLFLSIKFTTRKTYSRHFSSDWKDVIFKIDWLYEHWFSHYCSVRQRTKNFRHTKPSEIQDIIKLRNCLKGPYILLQL